MATDIRAGVTSLADSFQESESECGPTQAQWIAKSHGRHPKKTCFILPKNKLAIFDGSYFPFLGIPKMHRFQKNVVSPVWHPALCGQSQSLLKLRHLGTLLVFHQQRAGIFKFKPLLENQAK